MATAGTKFYCFTEDMAEKVHNLGSDVIKAVLTLSAPVVTNTVLANLTQIASGNGYTTGGNTCAVSTSAQSSGTYKLVLSSPTAWTSGATPMASFRYVTVYNSTASGGPLIGFYDYGSTVALATGETFTFTLDGTNGILQIS